MNDECVTFKLNEDDFLALLVKYEPALRGYARSLVPDWELVDEALQEASVTMWQKRGQLQGVDGFVPWARVILRFKCLKQLDKLRTRRTLLSVKTIEMLAARAENRSLEVAVERERALETCLSQFTSEQRELLLAPHSSTYSVVELAERRNKTANALYKLLGRLRKQLKECIDRRVAVEAGQA